MEKTMSLFNICFNMQFSHLQWPIKIYHFFFLFLFLHCKDGKENLTIWCRKNTHWNTIYAWIIKAIWSWWYLELNSYNEFTWSKISNRIVSFQLFYGRYEIFTNVCSAQKHIASVQVGQKIWLDIRKFRGIKIYSAIGQISW